MPNNNDVLASAKADLAKANNLTASVEGNPNSRFAPKAAPSHITGVKAAPRDNKPSYSLVKELNAKKDNIDQYKAATE